MTQKFEDNLALLFSTHTEGTNEETTRQNISASMDFVKAVGRTKTMLLLMFIASKSNNNHRLNINQYLTDSVVGEFVKALDEYGIDEFTISSAEYDTCRMAWFFTRRGFNCNGMILINCEPERLNGKQHFRTKPAFLFIKNK